MSVSYCAEMLFPDVAIEFCPNSVERFQLFPILTLAVILFRLSCQCL